ncbi:MAG: hypothetical protein FJY74_09215 [Candidatus Eisenbacteria bacterium]|nr:hypothetical protein [Candidatus Eisenbacteria bacterium]
MWKPPVFAVVATLALTACAFAGDVGLGLIAGEPTGVSVKVWSGSRTAFDGAVGWSLDESGWIYAHADYLWHRYDIEIDFPGALPFYVGVGGRVLFRESERSRVGIRVPIGLDYLTADRRFDFFLEIAPVVDLVPETEFSVSGGIGARFYF